MPCRVHDLCASDCECGWPRWACAQVVSFAQLSDIAEQTEYAGQGAQLMASLERAGERAAGINVEEALFDLPKSEWPRIAQLQKELQPYLDLWVRSDCVVALTAFCTAHALKAVVLLHSNMLADFQDCWCMPVLHCSALAACVPESMQQADVTLADVRSLAAEHCERVQH
jgi:hypothetical protein